MPSRGRKATRDTVMALLSTTPPPPKREPVDDVLPASDPDPEVAIVTAPTVEPADPAVEQAPAPVPTSAVEQRAPSPKPQPKPRTQPAPKRVEPEPDATGSPQVLAARIPSSLFKLVRDAKNRAGDTHEVWFLDAFDAVYDELDEVYAPRRVRRSRVPMRQRRTRRPINDPLVQYPLRLTREEMVVLEDRQKELAPPSLADMVTKIVELRLRQLGMLNDDDTDT